MFEKILEKFRKAGNIQFQRYAKPLIAVEDAIKIVEAVAKEYGKDTNVHTNADRIRSMSDEELAVLIASISDHCLAGIGEVNCSNAPNCDGCKNITLKWLKSEVKE